MPEEYNPIVRHHQGSATFAKHFEPACEEPPRYLAPEPAPSYVFYALLAAAIFLGFLVGLFYYSLHRLQ
jgi:hypothetical protein